jgi:hypothetical protein
VHAAPCLGTFLSSGLAPLTCVATATRSGPPTPSSSPPPGPSSRPAMRCFGSSPSSAAGSGPPGGAPLMLNVTQCSRSGTAVAAVAAPALPVPPQPLASQPLKLPALEQRGESPNSSGAPQSPKGSRPSPPTAGAVGARLKRDLENSCSCAAGARRGPALACCCCSGACCCGGAAAAAAAGRGPGTAASCASGCTGVLSCASMAPACVPAAAGRAPLLQGSGTHGAAASAAPPPLPRPPESWRCRPCPCARSCNRSGIWAAIRTRTRPHFIREARSTGFVPQRFQFPGSNACGTTLTSWDRYADAGTGCMAPRVRRGVRTAAAAPGAHQPLRPGALVALSPPPPNAERVAELRALAARRGARRSGTPGPGAYEPRPPADVCPGRGAAGRGGRAVGDGARTHHRPLTRADGPQPLPRGAPTWRQRKMARAVAGACGGLRGPGPADGRGRAAKDGATLRRPPSALVRRGAGGAQPALAVGP